MTAFSKYTEITRSCYIEIKRSSFMDSKVVLILVDGMASYAVKACKHPFIPELLKESIYNLDSTTVMPSVTLPCHMSLFHSVPPQRHGILTNTYVPQVRPIDGLMEQLKKSDKVKKILSVLNSLEPSIKPKQLVSTLSVAKKQIIEIAKAVASESDVIIMDEPTAAISENEIKRLFNIIKSLREKNVTVIYISHRLDEIFELGDYVTVMRDGRHIDTKPLPEVKDRSELIKMMIGKTVFEIYKPKEEQSEEDILEVKNVSNHKLNDISFKVKKGEIGGFYGLVGAGKTELARAIYGADEYQGEILFNGKKLIKAPDKAIAAGIALVPEERRTEGLFTLLTIRGNIPVMNMKKISKNGFINNAKERKGAKEYIDKLRIATSGMEKEVSKLSGGNPHEKNTPNPKPIIRPTTAPANR
jgi:ABC-type sugar transport system ATPase subunit